MNSGTSSVAFSFSAFADMCIVMTEEISHQVLLCFSHSAPGCSVSPCDLRCIDEEWGHAPSLFWVFLVDSCEEGNSERVLS